MHFCAFLVDFHSARLFFAMYGAFLGIFWVGVGIGDEQGSIFSFSTFWVFAFLAVFGIFWHFFGIFWVLVEVCAFLGY